MHVQHAAGPAFIDDDDDSPVAPPPPAAQTARTRAKHCTQQQVHLINLVITEALMPMIDMKPVALFPAHGYLAATHALLENTYGVIQPANSPVMLNSINFITPSLMTSPGTSASIAISSNPTPIAPYGKRALQTNSAAYSKASNIKGAVTCFFIRKNQMPHHKRATYGCICCNYCPQKDEHHCT
jgi:hypothetical protein